MSISRTAFTLMLSLILLPALLLAQKGPTKDGLPDIPYTKVTLENGLTVLIHEDHKAPIVAVNVWYHVGSKNEKEGKSGFAHLFEHLMFNGSENFNDDYFQPLERAGATDLNGTTSEDRTNYFENVPTSAFDMALWMESDRMGHLLGAVTQAKLDEQRGVVQNEKRQGENEPYAIAEELITKAVWPAGHPYSHTVIGSMEDLTAASLEDAKEWFRTYYGPSNAVLAIAGDVTAEAALAKVKKYFGDIPPGPPVAHFESWVAKRSGSTRQRAQDRVPQARLYKIWNVPGGNTKDATQLELIASLLSAGKSSRLYKRLVYDDQTATGVVAYLDKREIGSLFTIEATAKPGGDLAKIEKAIDEELARFLTAGPTEPELQRMKTQREAGFIRGIERIGGFGGKSDILAQNEVFGGSPDFYKTTFSWMKSSTAGELKKVGAEWLTDGVYILEINPFPTLSAAPPDTALRKKVPDLGEPPKAEFPAFQKATLPNGMRIILARRTSVPVVNFQMMFDAGYAADQPSSAGTANLAMNMMDEGTRTRSALQISDELQALGANLGTGAGIDYCFASLSALKSNLDKSLELYADVILNPAFPKADFERLQKQTIASIQRERAQPMGMAVRVLPGLLFGKDHAYGMPLTGSGYEATVAKLTPQEMATFHQTWIRPNNATLIVVGDATLDEIRPKLEKLFKEWKPATAPKKNVAPVAMDHPSRVYIMDKPGALQSVVFAAQVSIPKNNPDEIAINAMNAALGGTFTSRLNMNLREEKHWSYGAGSVILGTSAQRPFIAYSPVQADKTKETMVEIRKELSSITAEKPPTDDETAKVKKSLTLELPGLWETNGSIQSSLANLVQYGYPDDYYKTYPAKVSALGTADLGAAAKKFLHPGNLVWVIVGDRSKIESGVKELNFGEMHFIDADGNTIK